jgi:predicted alpha/beta-fold hydrolase
VTSKPTAHFAQLVVFNRNAFRWTQKHAAIACNAAVKNRTAHQTAIGPELDTTWPLGRFFKQLLFSALLRAVALKMKENALQQNLKFMRFSAFIPKSVFVNFVTVDADSVLVNPHEILASRCA